MCTTAPFSVLGHGGWYWKSQLQCPQRTFVHGSQHFCSLSAHRQTTPRLPAETFVADCIERENIAVDGRLRCVCMLTPVTLHCLTNCRMLSNAVKSFNIFTVKQFSLAWQISAHTLAITLSKSIRIPGAVFQRTCKSPLPPGLRQDSRRKHGVEVENHVFPSASCKGCKEGRAQKNTVLLSFYDSSARKGPSFK